jgi:hypothetical protein
LDKAVVDVDPKMQELRDRAEILPHTPRLLTDRDDVRFRDLPAVSNACATTGP